MQHVAYVTTSLRRFCRASISFRFEIGLPKLNLIPLRNGTTGISPNSLQHPESAAEKKTAAH
jgi:hypothetical protein